MAQPPGGASTPSHTVTRRVRRGIGGWWVLALVLVPLVVAALATWTTHGSIEDDLHQRTMTTLADHGISGVTVEFSGRDAVLTIPAGVDPGKAKALTKDVSGVRAVTLEASATSAGARAAESARCTDLGRRIKALMAKDKPSFADNSTQLRPAPHGPLSRVADLVQQCPHAKITVTGYTDSRGSAASNQQLSRARAESVRAYLVQHGGNPDHITAVGRGEADPVASNDSDAGRSKNRRVEITVAGG